jgi:ligand-binding sensor domain-containing protein/signal transduction histidine kinase
MWGAPAASKAVLPEFTTRTWGKEDGLPDDSVTAVLQTHEGYLWVGTSRGLARFDGVKFFPVSIVERRRDGGLRVTALCEDSAHRLWIGTQDDGLFCCHAGRVSRLSQALLSDRTINCITEDKAGNLWVGTPSGLDRVERSQLPPTQLEPSGKAGAQHFKVREGLPSDFVSGVQLARSGAVWITTRGGICQYRGGTIERMGFEIESLGRSPEFLGVYEDRRGNLWTLGDTCLVNLAEGNRINRFGSGERIWTLCEGRQGQLWIGTSGQGLFTFDGDAFLPVNFGAGRLPSDVRALCEDREGNLWLGTYGSGLVRLQPRRVRQFDTAAGLPSDTPTCLAQDSEGRLWVGFEHAGLYVGGKEHFEPKAAEGDAATLNRISALAATPDGTLWVGTYGSGLYALNSQRMSVGLHLTTANGLSDDTILALAAETNGVVWVSTPAGGLHRWAGGKLQSFGPESGLSGQPIGVLLPAADGRLWLGTEAGEVWRREHERFRPENGAAALAGRAVRALQEDHTGRLWVGTAGGLLACRASDRWLTWDARLGLEADAILTLLSDDSGGLWLGTRQGLTRLGTEELKQLLSAQSPPRGEVLLEAELAGKGARLRGWPSALWGRDGRLWFICGNGLAAFDPHDLGPQPLPPPIYIEEVWANGEPLRVGALRAPAATQRPGAGLRLPAKLQSVEIEFSVPCFTAPEKVRFRHKLEGFDTDWVEGGAERRVRYGRLPYGEYAFWVKAGDPAGFWEESTTSFRFRVVAPAWRTWWALTLYGLSAAGALTATVRLVSHRRLRARLERLAQAEAMQRERMRIAQDMHDEIGSKLTKISFMSERAKGELHEQGPVATKLEAIASTSRNLLQVLDEIVWAVNPHNDNLEHLAAYLGQYATEYLQNTAVECELHLPRGLPPQPLSAEVRHNVFLAFEEALNNALKHAGASRVRIDMTAEDSRFTITLEDNGHGFDAAQKAVTSSQAGNGSGKRGGHGLPNIRHRLAEAGGDCVIRSQPGKGTTVTLSLPLRTL